MTAPGAERIGGAGDLVAAIAARAPGDRVTVTARRGSRRLSFHLTLADQPVQAGG